MVGATWGIVFLSLVMFNSIIPACSQSPCPNIFRYMSDNATGEIMGRIEIPGAPRNVALHIRIGLSVAAVLPTKYVGRLDLATSQIEAVRAVQEGRPLVYHLYFPIRNPIPSVTAITFNGQRYCTGSPATGSSVTSIYLEHTLYPPGVKPLSNNRPATNTNIVPVPSGINIFSPRPTSKPTAGSNIIPILRPVTKVPILIKLEPPTERPLPVFPTSAPVTNPQNPFLNQPSNNNQENCGRPTTVNHLIAHGESTTPGQWPWIAAVFVAKMNYEFLCGGSLITDRHVLTAAHCKITDDGDVPASAFLVALGRYHLNNWREEGSKTFEVLEFRTHPQYLIRNSADADLAMIVLREKVNFTPKIQPLCLWSRPIDLESVVGLNGYVVGWGRDESGNLHLHEPRVAQTPIVSQAACLQSHLAFQLATSNRTLCAGRRDGTGPCNGDSGSALVILDSNTGRYHLRGIVSLSPSDLNTLTCDLSKFVVYVDTAQYLDWIRTQSSN